MESHEKLNSVTCSLLLTLDNLQWGSDEDRQHSNNISRCYLKASHWAGQALLIKGG